MHGDGNARGFNRAGAQHREFLQRDAQVRIRLDEVQHVTHRALAVAAIVIEELNEIDIALRIAEHHAVRGIEQRVGMLLHRGLLLGHFGRGLTLAEFDGRFFQHFGMRDQIVSDHFLNVLALRIGERLCRGGDGREAHGKREGEWCERAKG